MLPMYRRGDIKPDPLFDEAGAAREYLKKVEEEYAPYNGADTQRMIRPGYRYDASRGVESEVQITVSLDSNMGRNIFLTLLSYIWKNGLIDVGDFASSTFVNVYLS